MEDYPTNQLEFEKRFGEEEACREYLVKIRWPDGFRCPACGLSRAWVSKRGLYQCRSCGRQTSLTAGTIFQDTRLPLRLWFRAMWAMTGYKHGVSALSLQRVLGMKRYETVWIWLHKLRAAMVRPGRERLSGTVEVDETYVGGAKAGKRGRGAAGKALVAIAVEDKEGDIGRVRLRRIPDASAKSLEPFILENVAPGSSVRTDGWGAYSFLPQKGFGHEVARQSAEVGDDLLPLAHRLASLLKRWLVGTHQGAVRASHLDYYLDEFTFRFNRRTSRSRGKLFYRLVQQAASVEPRTRNSLRKESQVQPHHN
jgi:transposase-like protein/ribosomal protein L37AE/L43A